MRGSIAPPVDILRRAPWTMRIEDSRRVLANLLLWLVVAGLIYGAAMGTFRGLAGQSDWLKQIVYSAVKVPVLLTVAFAISLPSFYVINTLVGLRRDFGEAVRALIATQAGLAIILASLAPLTLFWYASSPNYNQAILFNGVMFAVASFSSQLLLRGYYGPLIQRNPRHRILLRCWIGVYVLVAIQLAWLLRPFVGFPGAEVQFVRPEAWDNAYVVVLRLIWQTLFQ